MTINAWLELATHRLQTAGIETARLDTLVLLEDCLHMERGLLLARPEQKITAAQQAELQKLLKRRGQHEPLAYVRGHTEFYGRDFVITPAVLEPRPESETMIDLLGDLMATGKLATARPDFSQNYGNVLKIADVGTGSGALGITAKLEFPAAVQVKVDLLEIDPQALEVAQMNVDKYTMSIDVMMSDLLEGSAGDYDVLLCNLPYVPDDYTLNPAALHEPKLAIFGGPDGLNVYRKLFEQVTQLSKQPLFILTESLPPQHGALEVIGNQHGYEVLRSEDFIQVFQLGSISAVV